MANEIAKTPPRRRQAKTGVVKQARMQKTIVVEVTRLVKHRLYQRVVRVSKKFYAHDENSEARAGDTVRIVETRPLSRMKCWRLAEILSRGGGEA